MLAWPLLALVIGSLVYCVLTVIAALRYRSSGTARQAATKGERIGGLASLGDPHWGGQSCAQPPFRRLDLLKAGPRAESPPHNKQYADQKSLPAAKTSDFGSKGLRACATGTAPISILKPLAGVDEGLEQNLRTFFEQRYPEFEILFAVREPDDPAIAIVETLRAKFPNVPSRLIVTGNPSYPNAKVYSLHCMLAAARHDLLVMSDSDIRITPDMLQTVAREFSDPAIGMATCPYRAVPGRSFWSTLEAIGLNTEFIGGVLVARMLEGMKFAIGPTIVSRRATLERIGGFDAVKDYLAEDFVMGKLAAERGDGVILSSYVIEHRIGSQQFAVNLRHRLRWNRSTRRSRPAGYVGQVFTNPLPLALMLWAAKPEWWPMVALTAMFRAAAAWATAGFVLRDPLTARLWWLVPLQDIASFLIWIGGFFGNTIQWRGRKYSLLRDGRFELAP